MFLQAKNKYGTYFIPEESQARPCSRTVLEGRVWEQATIDCILENTSTGNVVHCGAFFGDMLPALSQGTSNTIYAFEPAPINYQAAVQTVQSNNLQNVVLANQALSNTNSELNFVDRQGGTSHITINDTGLTVQSVCLDDVVSEQVDVIHLDVERHELQALQGSYKLIKKYLPTLIIENPVKHEWWINIEQLGYREVGRCDVNYIWQVK